MNWIFRCPEVEKTVGLSRSTIYFEMEKGKFPRPVPLGKASVGWLESEIQAYIDARVADREAGVRTEGNGFKPGQRRVRAAPVVIEDNVPIPDEGWRSN